MSYLVLARRYRPQRFGDVMGQDVIVRTIRNSLSSDQIAHAYLLTGIRGVGKTTLARLMAMAVNCLDLQKDSEPCGKCKSCESIMSGSLDVQEMDAASHTGVNDIREILETVVYPPTHLKYKVYIIDEAHMLSNSAFNALLKTLEEPPAHTLFILATTESEKLPVTVRSRCQRFDLRSIGSDEIQAYVGELLSKEGIAFDEDALQMLSIASEGSVRDALTLCERVLAYADKHVSLEAVQHSLGLVVSESVKAFTEAVFASDTGVSLNRVREVINLGQTGTEFYRAVARQWHQLMCFKLDQSAELHGAPEPVWMESVSSSLSYHDIDLMYQVLVRGMQDLKLMDERMGAEVLAMRLSQLQRIGQPFSGSIEDAGNKRNAEDEGNAGGGVKPDKAIKKTTPEKAVQEAVASPYMADEKEASVPPPAKSVGQPKDIPVMEEASPDAQDLLDDGVIREAVQDYSSWEDAVHAYAELYPQRAAQFEHMVCLEFGHKVKVAMNKMQEETVLASDRMAFADWMGREVLWESQAEESDGESIAQKRERRAAEEKRRALEKAQQDPHIQALQEKLGATLVNVLPAGVQRVSEDMNNASEVGKI